MAQSIRRWGAMVLAVALAGCGSGAAVTGSVNAPATGSNIASATGSHPPGTTGASSTTTAAVPSVTLPQGPDALADGFRVSASIGGGPPVTMLVDTGSNGMVVSRRYVGSGVTSLNPVQHFTGFTYSSSGNTYNGEWMSAVVAFDSGSNGGAAETAPIRIRVVDEACVADTCSSDESTSTVAMLGVGFDRGGDNPAQAAMGGPAINPFLNLAPMVSGAMPQAYLISQDAIVLGPAATDLTGFQTVPLTRTTPAAGVAADWTAASACIAVPSGGVGDQCGSLLLDTGLSYAIVQVPTGVAPPVSPAPTGERPLVENGQQVAVTASGLSAPIYAFTVGAAGAPQKVEWGHQLHDGQAFMNISRFALSQVDYLYDATSGQVGFRHRG